MSFRSWVAEVWRQRPSFAPFWVIEQLCVDIDEANAVNEVLTEHIRKLRGQLDVVSKRLPTQDEGNEFALPTNGVSIPETRVPVGNHNGRMCGCGYWVYGGPAVCTRCNIKRALPFAIPTFGRPSPQAAPLSSRVSASPFQYELRQHKGQKDQKE